ncbi:MAG: MBOAT family protein [Flavobacteriales bacterium]|nr:MBOAT family protein [Flavobacteriales bacterium]
MVFSSTLFLSFFLPIFLLAYYFTPSKYRNWTALFFSLAFYAWGAPVFIFFLVGSCVFDFYLIKGFNSPNRKTYLLFSLLLNIGLLAYFKYANFFVENMDAALGGNVMSWESVVLPIGISFFTFQKISYSLDVYWKKNQQLTRFNDYLLFIVLFPQLIAGPIVRFRDIAGQITDRSANENYTMRINGMFRFIIGLSKKVLIANVLAEYVHEINQVYELTPYAVTSASAWVVAIAYTFQIYFDFPGYSDMAIGLGKMIGFKFPENFNFPYLSRSITEFWQRWHITLGTWMRDYLYIPLGGNQNGKIRTYINLSLVFIISGFWHGAAWNFIIWGAFHGFLLVIERLFLGKVLKKLPGIISVFYTFGMVLFGWVFFSASSLTQSWFYLCKMFEFNFETDLNLSIKFTFFLILAIGFSFYALNSKFIVKVNSFQDTLAAKKIWVLVIGFLVGIFLFTLCMSEIMTAGFNPFIYYRF